jgi:hypothetical protein
MAVFEKAGTGDLVFLIPKTQKTSDQNSPIWLGQKFLPSTSTFGTTICHVGIFLKSQDREDERAFLTAGKTWCVFESGGTCGGPRIMEREIGKSLEIYNIIVISPFSENTKGGDESTLRALIKIIATSFAQNFYDVDTPIPPCSQYHMMLAPCVGTVFPTGNQKREIAEGLTDALLGNPRLGGVDCAGKFIHKQSFCGEYVHWILQASFFMYAFETTENTHIKSLIDQEIAACAKMKAGGKNIKSARDRIVALIQRNFDVLFPAEVLKKIPFWAQEPSVTYNPGKLYTEITRAKPPGTCELVSRSLLGIASAIPAFGRRGMARIGAAGAALYTRVNGLCYRAAQTLCPRVDHAMPTIV